MASRPAQVGWLILRTVLRVLWVSTMVLTPLFGFWLASSFAAYQNASQWLALLGGLVMFPIIPLGWDLVFVWRRSKQEAPRKAILTRLDRLVLRTLLVNGLFIFCMLFFARTTAVRSLAVRGDWIVDGHHGPIANGIRGFLLAFADRFDRKTATDHYGDSDDAPDPSTIKPPSEPERPIDPTATVKPPKFDTGWPFDAAVDPLVTGMPADAQASIETVGAYLRDKFPDRKLRAKAIHDFVALRLTYDDAALKLIIARDYKNVPSQKAEDVFAAKVGVCEGYARLMTALGAAASVEIKYVTGYIRDAQRRIVAAGNDDTIKSALEGYSHAWNAALIDDEWMLIDTTWDDPKDASDPIATTYLFTPPKLFAFDHLPEDPAWQLVVDPLSPGDFARQPMMSPAIGELGMRLVEPTRSQISVDGEATIILDNPYRAKVSAFAMLDNGDRNGREIRCETKPRGATQLAITCDLPDGEYEVRMFGAPASAGEGGVRYSLDYIGSILVNSR